MSEKPKGNIKGSQIYWTKAQWDAYYAAKERKKELATNIRSTAYATVLDLVSEGEIEGLVDGLKSIYLDQTPIQNQDGSFNFEGVSVDSRTGTQDQTYIPGFGEVQDDIVVNVKVTYIAPVIRGITNPNIDAVIVKLNTPNLTLTNINNGEIGGNSIQYKIQLQSNGGGFVDVVDTEMIGKSTSEYQKSHRIELVGSAPWDIKLIRLKKDSTSPYDLSDLYFDSYTEIIDVKLRYPNSAIVATKVDASKFSTIPTRAFHLKGLKIKIPSNATVNSDGSLSYSGVWNGTFSISYCNNPAWCFYDILTNDRYGVGQYISSSQIDKWALYSIGVYCDEKVDTGLGGQEPRFSCNIYLQSAEQAYKVLSDMATIFRGMVYWSNGSIVAAQDAPSDAVYLYTQANVIDGDFTYSGASTTAKHTVALVTWNDPEDFYSPKVEYVEDQLAIVKYGIIKTQVTAMGCTSRGQANRVGRWILHTEQNESEVVAFKTGIEGAVARPGQIINIADANRSGRRMAGRISSATINSITVDSDLALSYVGETLFTLLPDGTVEQKIIQSQTGRVLTTTTDFSNIPSTIWMISTSDLEVQTFRILSVAETKNTGELDISAIKHDPAKFDAVENGLTLPERKYSIFKQVPSTPENLLATENLYSTPQGVKSKVTISWDQIPRVTSYIVKYQKDLNNIIALGTVTINDVEIFDTSPGTYTFIVYALDAIGGVSAPAYLTSVLYGKSAPPSDVQNFSLFPNANAALLSWTQSIDLDVIVGGSVRIRHTPRFDNPTWASSIDVIDFVPGSNTATTAPLLAGTYLAKFVDSSGNESVNEAIIATTTPLPVGLNIVEVVDESGVFAGTKVNTYFNPDLGLVLDTDALWDDLGNIDDIAELIDSIGNVTAQGSYYFSETTDLGQVFTSNLTALIKTLAFDTGLFWDDRTDNIDDWTDIDGASAANVNAKLYLRTTEDDPSFDAPDEDDPMVLVADWTVWKPFLTGSYLARGYQFRIDLSTASSHQNIAVEQLSVTIDMPDRTEEHDSIMTDLSSSFHVDFDYSFNAIPALGIITHDMVGGDYYQLLGKTVSGFDIVFKNASNVIIQRTFDAVVKGYGLKG